MTIDRILYEYLLVGAGATSIAYMLLVVVRDRLNMSPSEKEFNRDIRKAKTAEDISRISSILIYSADNNVPYHLSKRHFQ